MVAETEQPNGSVDARVYFAAERTLLAWIRTGLAMMGFGFVVARFGLFLREMAAARTVQSPHQSGFSLWVGVALVVCGVLVNLCAAARHWHTIRRLQKGLPIRFHPLSFAAVVALMMGFLGLFIAAYLLFGLNPPN